MSKVFQADVCLIATVYVKADTPEAAKAIFDKEFKDSDLEVIADDVMVSGRTFNDKRLPEISFSPAMSINDVTGWFTEANNG